MTNVSIAPSLVAMSRVRSIMCSSAKPSRSLPCPAGCGKAATQPERRLHWGYSIHGDERWKNLHYGDYGVFGLGPGIGNCVVENGRGHRDRGRRRDFDE